MIFVDLTKLPYYEKSELPWEEWRDRMLALNAEELLRIAVLTHHFDDGIPYAHAVWNAFREKYSNDPAMVFTAFTRREDNSEG